MKENVDYELIAGKEDHWDIRILNGPYTETVYHYNRVYIDEVLDALKYNAEIVSTPDAELDISDVQFQRYIGEILVSILDREAEEK